LAAATAAVDRRAIRSRRAVRRQRDLGIEKYSYPRFLLWSAIGGALWSDYTCVLAYAVGTALANFPLASVVIFGTITTILLAVIFWKLRRDRRATEGASA
jgi:membrane protein DedA with SNARE-associated domain